MASVLPAIFAVAVIPVAIVTRVLSLESAIVVATPVRAAPMKVAIMAHFGIGRGDISER